jgi:hypothetical protein
VPGLYCGFWVQTTAKSQGYKLFLLWLVSGLGLGSFVVLLSE